MKCNVTKSGRSVRMKRVCAIKITCESTSEPFKLVYIGNGWMDGEWCEGEKKYKTYKFIFLGSHITSENYFRIKKIFFMCRCVHSLKWWWFGNLIWMSKNKKVHVWACKSSYVTKCLRWKLINCWNMTQSTFLSYLHEIEIS